MLMCPSWETLCVFPLGFKPEEVDNWPFDSGVHGPLGITGCGSVVWLDCQSWMFYQKLNLIIRTRYKRVGSITLQRIRPL